MIDLNQLLTVSGLAIFLGIITQFLKRGFNLDTEQIPAIVVLLGVAIELLVAYSLNMVKIPGDVLGFAFQGFLAACAATGGYENIDKLLRKSE